MTRIKSQTVSLNDGAQIPILGLGVWEADSGGEARQAVEWALEAGYRHVDTATAYGNEKDVGQGIRDSGVPREELFITTKLWNSDQGRPSSLDACRRSLDALGLDYLDLYLIHWPVAGKRSDSWKALVELKEKGLCKSIGVSNYMIRHLQELLDESDVTPAVNQVEFSPFLRRKALHEFCAGKGVAIEAYSPLTRAKRLDDPRLAQIGGHYGKTAAQVLIRWCIEHEVIVIPKSVHKDRIEENGDVFDFEISPEDMAVLDDMDENFHTLPPDWQPENWQ